MKLVSFECPNCGANIYADFENRKAICEYCEKEFILDDEFKRVILDKQNIRDLADEISKSNVEMQNYGADAGLIASVHRIYDTIEEYSLTQSAISNLKTKIDGQTITRNNISTPFNKFIPWLSALAMIFVLVEMVRYSIIFLLFRVLIFLLGLIVTFISARVINYILNNTVIEMDRELNDLKRELKEQQDKLSYLRRIHGYDLIPDKYLNVSAVGYILEVLTDKRAITLQQAINVYEEKLHRDKIEAMRMEEIRLQQQQLKELKKMNEQKEKNDDLGLGDLAKIGGAIAVGVAVGKKIKDDLF